MADQEADIVAKIASGVSRLNAVAWDRLGGTDPFVSHAFLAALEQSGSVGRGTGWTPAPLLIEDGADHLLGLSKRCGECCLAADLGNPHIGGSQHSPWREFSGGNYYVLSREIG